MILIAIEDHNMNLVETYIKQKGEKPIGYLIRDSNGDLYDGQVFLSIRGLKSHVTHQRVGRWHNTDYLKDGYTIVPVYALISEEIKGE